MLRCYTRMVKVIVQLEAMSKIRTQKKTEAWEVGFLPTTNGLVMATREGKKTTHCRILFSTVKRLARSKTKWEDKKMGAEITLSPYTPKPNAC